MVYVVVALEDEICKAAVTARLSKKFPFFLATTVALFSPSHSTLAFLFRFPLVRKLSSQASKVETLDRKSGRLFVWPSDFPR